MKNREVLESRKDDRGHRSHAERLEKKQYVISNMKVIHVVQEEVMRNMIKEKNELKEDSDGLKKEIHVVKR